MNGVVNYATHSDTVIGINIGKDVLCIKNRCPYDSKFVLRRKDPAFREGPGAGCQESVPAGPDQKHAL
jgi:hypothetical protein